MPKFNLGWRKSRPKNQEAQHDARVPLPLVETPIVRRNGQKSQGEDTIPGRLRSSNASGKPGRVDEHVVAFHNPNSAEAEQYRKLYTELVRAAQTRPLRTVLITSALAGEGKTTSALNLAVTAAASSGDDGTLLIEMDFRKPRVGKFLGIRPETGLVDFLTTGVDSDDLFTPTEIPGLTVVHAGKRVKNPISLLTSSKLERFFETIKARSYRHIILDSSPVLLTFEANLLLRYVDTTMLVVHARESPRDMVQKAIESIGRENILGCLFNGVLPSDFYYYSHYYSSDYYHMDADE